MSGEKETVLLTCSAAMNRFRSRKKAVLEQTKDTVRS
jgi:hypothetical protein